MLNLARCCLANFIHANLTQNCIGEMNKIDKFARPSGNLTKRQVNLTRYRGNGSQSQYLFTRFYFVLLIALQVKEIQFPATRFVAMVINNA